MPDKTITTPDIEQMISWLLNVDIIPLGTSGRRMRQAIIDELRRKK